MSTVQTAPMLCDMIAADILLGTHSKTSGTRMWSYLHLVDTELEDKIQSGSEALWIPGKTEVLTSLGVIKSIREHV